MQRNPIKRTIRYSHVALFSTIAVSVVPSAARTQETAVRDSLARELVEITVTEDQLYAVVDGIIVSTVEQIYADNFAFFLEAVAFGTDEERAAAGRLVQESQERFIQGLRNSFFGDTDFVDLNKRIWIGLYAKHFSEDELTALLALQRTPIARKLAAKLPELMVGAMQALNKEFDSRLPEVSAGLVENEFGVIGDALFRLVTSQLARLPVQGRQLTVDAEVSGRLSEADTTVGGSYTQAWGLELRAGQLVTVDMISEDFDAYLWVTGPGLEQPLDDDDSGGACHARITFATTVGGLFRVIAASSMAGVTGRFTLRAAEQAGPVADEACEEVGDPTQTFLEAVVDERPERLSGPVPQYPEMLRQAGIEGTVLLEFVIDTMGRVEEESIKILRSTNTAFEAPARDVIRQSLYSPGRVRGQAVRTMVTQQIGFSVQRTRDTTRTTGMPPPTLIVTDSAAVDEPPRLLASPPLQYPDSLRGVGIEGVVVLEFVIDTTGHAEPSSITVIESPHPAFSDIAKDAVLVSVYSPGQKNGVPVPARVRQSLTFRNQR